MEKSDWLAIVLGFIFLGGGSLMSTFGRRMMRIGGLAMVAIGIAGLIFWFAYYRNADAQGGGNCNNYGPNGTISGSCNTTVNPIIHDANGLYQDDERVGKIQQPSINEAQGIARFAAASFSEYPDPNKPLEYGNLILNCDNVPRQPPNTFVGTLSAMVVGFQCRIIGKTTQKPASSIGNDNTIVGISPPPTMGSGNTIVGPTDSRGNTIINQGGTAIGSGSCADATGIAIGAGARAGCGK